MLMSIRLLPKKESKKVTNHILETINLKPRSLFPLVLLTLFVMVFSLACGGGTATVSTTATTTTTTTTTQPITTTTTTTTTEPPTTTTTEPPTTTTTEPPTTTGSEAPVLTLAALTLTAPTHSAAVATLCLMCHGVGVGVQQYPVAPSWDGTPLTPGPWTVTAGSDQDHTGGTDVATCTQDGCHAAPWVETSTPPATTSEAPTTTTSAPTTTEAQSGRITVLVSTSGFYPPTITITAGSTNLWKNAEHPHHEIESDDELFGDIVPAGGTYEFTFETPAPTNTTTRRTRLSSAPSS